MRNVTIENFMGVKSAQFEIKKTVLIYGDNGGGKTSSLIGTACAISGEALPIKGVTKAGAIQLVNDSAREGFAKVETQGGSKQIHWPSCEAKQTGSPINSSAVALGMNPLQITDKKQRSSFFSDLLKSTPTEEDLKKETKEIAGEKYTSIWKQIKANGWDKASKLYSDKSREQQGAWKAITSETGWGSSKGESWVPKHWSPDLEESSEAELEAAKVAANKEVEACVAAEAVGEEKVKELEALVAQLPGIQSRIKKNERLLTRCAEELKKLGDRPEPIKLGDSGCPCPECKTHLVMKEGKLERASADEFTQADVDIRNEEIAKYNADFNRIQKLSDDAKKANAEYAGMVKNSTNAEVELSEIQRKESESQGQRSDLNEARERLRIATANLEAFVQKEKATRAHKAAIYYRQVSKVLSTDGLRKKLLAEKLEELNKEIKEVFPEYLLSISESLDAKWDGRPLDQCCESEKWRAAVALRGVIAKRNKDEVFLIDAADILSNHRLNKLLSRLQKHPSNCVIALTIKSRADAKQIPEKLGRAYYVDGGIMEEL